MLVKVFGLREEDQVDKLIRIQSRKFSLFSNSNGIFQFIIDRHNMTRRILMFPKKVFPCCVTVSISFRPLLL
jgi:hypothetical protein